MSSKDFAADLLYRLRQEARLDLGVRAIDAGRGDYYGLEGISRDQVFSPAGDGYDVVCALAKARKSFCAVCALWTVDGLHLSTVGALDRIADIVDGRGRYGIPRAPAKTKAAPVRVEPACPKPARSAPIPALPADASSVPDHPEPLFSEEYADRPPQRVSSTIYICRPGLPTRIINESGWDPSDEARWLGVIRRQAEVSRLATRTAAEALDHAYGCVAELTITSRPLGVRYDVAYHDARAELARLLQPEGVLA